MARPMKQLPRTNDPLVAFARDLQALRKEAGDPPLALLAEHSGLSTATLSNAHAGKKLPTWATVNGYVLACGGDPEEWSTRWESLRLDAAGISGDLFRDALRRWERTGALTPPHVDDVGELRELLKTLLDFNGLSHRTLAKQAPGYSHVTYGAVLRGARPLKAKILYQILIGCGVHSIRSQEAWFHLLSSFSRREGVEGGKLLARVEPPHRYAGDIDMKTLKATLERLERGRGLFAADIVSYDSINALRTAYEDMLALLLTSLQRSRIRLPHKFGDTISEVAAKLQTNSIPNPAAIAAILPLAMPFHPRLRTRVVMALKNAGDLLRRADNGKLSIRGVAGLHLPLPPTVPFQRTAPTAS
ncbi:hypothetical protein EST92_28485 [Streptomyces sp. TM32]|uniref:hypothetical protein n=1 Tax=Streptomyces sp. TM32 TaxID=1652669 RepID=UPI001013914B|nr:hypothetical protein [Streptomyces sp. TM32]RXS66694.1 hypothetical protein EST92_28485 [Streptomyces sp. TM32]